MIDGVAAGRALPGAEVEEAMGRFAVVEGGKGFGVVLGRARIGTVGGWREVKIARSRLVG